MARAKVAVYIGGVRGQADESEKIELSLQQRQVAILAAFALVLLGVVFALGVMVGRQLASASLAAPAQPPPGDLRALDAEKPPPKPVAAPVPVAVAKPDDDDADAAAPGVKPAPKIAPDRAQPAPAAAAAKTDRAPAPARASAPVPAPAPAPAVAEAAPPSPEELTKEDADDEEKPAAKTAAPAKIAPAAAANESAAADSPDAQPAHLGKFTVQFGATQDHKDALKIAARAKAQGVKQPYIVTAQIEGKGTWYRLRAGSFDSRDDAAAYSKTVDASLKGVHSAVMPTAPAN